MKATATLVLLTLLTLHAQPVEVAEASIADLQRALTEGRATSRELVQAYLNRIAAFDQQGPRLNALITLNPNALAEADALDRERKAKGPRGPLHGIPIIVKDNYSTRDMPTTAGTLALAGFTPNADAFQVKKLRDAGAILIAKSNLHELASGITTVGSAFGQSRNPYDPTRHPGGSSGGTGAAVAASLAAAGMGSDTCGSIRIPASVNNLTGLRPTKGLSSIAGIVPLSVTQDTGGPLARTVADLAAVLDATTGEDPNDAATRNAPKLNFTAALQPGALKGAKIGILEPLFGDATDDTEVLKLVRTAIDDLKKQGATVSPVPMKDLLEALNNSSVITHEFKEDLAQYLATHGPAPVHSLEEIVKGGLIHTALEATFARHLASKGRGTHDHKIALAKRAAVQQMILKLMEEEKLDALVYPTLRRKPVRIGEAQPGGTCQLSATTGFPAITVPAGFTADGLPVGLELLGPAFSDAKLLGYAYAYEQATHHRRAPARTPSVKQLAPRSWQNSATNLTAKFTLTPATGELAYAITATLPPGEILAATLHRTTKDDTGPVIAVLANRHFQQLSGTETLSDPDREKLAKGGLYLRLTTKSTVLKLTLQP